MHLNWVQPARGNMKGIYPYIDFAHVTDTATTTALALSGSGSNYITLANSNTNPAIGTSGGSLVLLTNNLTNTLFTNSGGADVNYISISSNVTTAGPVITAAGETNVTLHLRSKGTGNVVIGSDGYPIIQLTAGTAANYLVFSNAANDPGITTASAGAIKISTSLQITGYVAPTAGVGTEVFYDSSSPAGGIICYDRTTATWKALTLYGASIGFYTSSTLCASFGATGILNLVGTPGFVGGSKYLILDGSGNVRVSALGPAS